MDTLIDIAFGLFKQHMQQDSKSLEIYKKMQKYKIFCKIHDVYFVNIYIYHEQTNSMRS
jgi:hypothetical protein